MNQKVMQTPGIIHHGAVDGVTGSCHQLNISPHQAILVDCGSFQPTLIRPQAQNY
ncbi:hypothetical protein [Catenovulum adriaticum]|uniref:Uncharacterized protein n=1 Tax=Catenovulum adriaticum TaxID=2984846 RepID=A0ABY7AJG8_9ALTE|nr:hypothetical protein [Catenovulum sp. TS8]WAJ69368.1 hypothetical protein OLW01_09255 [Catenovulum sp. TS8]